jgi:hypothetical protein
MVPDLNYRLFREEDLSSLLQLWEEAGWGQLSPDTWREWFLTTPYGPCLVVVAVNDQKEVMGQAVFTPTELDVNNRVVRALRLSAPILRQAIRNNSLRSLHHPAIALWLTGAIAAASLGYGLVYALPDPNWLPFFRTLYRFKQAEYRCLEAPLNGNGKARLPGGAAWQVQPVSAFGPEFQSLWEAARRSFAIGCGVRRSPEWLSYRNGDHHVLAVRAPRDESLAGYVSVHKQTGLIMDLAARNSAELTPVLAAALGWLAHQPAGSPFSINRDHVKVMETPVLRAALSELSFTPVDYHFAFVCDPLDPSLSPEEVHPGQWYIMPGD